MSYLDTISLQSAKDYLGVDDTSRDSEITRMIQSALKYLEKRTNIIMDARNIQYILDENGCIRVYDWPINTPDSSLSATVKRTQKGLYSIYEDIADNASILTLNVGSNDVDSDLLEAAYMLIEHYFVEGDRNALPKMVEDIIQTNKRFVI